MDLRQLEYFQMVARLGSVTLAAQQLHVSQSTVTLSVQKLETELGLLLFDRSQKHLALTAEGGIFLQRIADVLNRLQDAVTELNNYRMLQRGSLTVGIPPMIGAFLFPEILARFTKLYPQLQLATYEEGSFIIRQSLEKEDIDIGIVNLMQPSPLLEIVPIVRQPMYVCCSHDHPLAAEPCIAIERLRDEPFILFKESAYNRQLILDECRRHGFTPRIVLSSDQIETMKGLVAKGVGICFLIEEIARSSKEFAARPLASPLYVDFGLAWKKDKYLSKAAQAFIAFIRSVEFARCDSAGR